MLDKLICKKREKKSGVETGFPKGTRRLGIIFFLLFLLLAAGAGYGQIAMFLTTLMMVGIVTLPLEVTYFGKRLAVMRNALGLAYAVLASFLLGYIL